MGYKEDFNKYPLTGYRDSELRILHNKVTMAAQEFEKYSAQYLSIWGDKGEQHGKENLLP